MTAATTAKKTATSRIADPELRAIHTILKTLSGIEAEDVRRRVLTYVNQRENQRQTDLFPQGA